MRIWSIHPKYLDAKGIVALWRETLLAKNVLEGNTKGYKNHPQLKRFRAVDNPIGYINKYLLSVYDEAVDRGYNFDRRKIGENISNDKIEVTDSQLKYETQHLKNKLKIRDQKRYETLKNDEMLSVNPIFKLVKGEIESWEIIK
ncbi:MAG TPA: pyrimidine dimer DNA glycosylase/endonuclease V [Bacteroidales bacterium]|nr:pyrimidine dimer DNA glycosylase/endonuclease V [Bacteroidales bacterium]